MSSLLEPLMTSNYLFKNKGNNISQVEYSKTIGNLMFLMNYTRSYIAYNVSRLSRYTHNLISEHWIAHVYLSRLNTQ